MKYSATTGGAYKEGFSGNIPEDAKPISDETYTALFLTPLPPGKCVQPDAAGLPTLADIPPPMPTTDGLCMAIDHAADTARRAVAGDPLRAVEYDRARIEAEQFSAAGYLGTVPPMVAAWAINGRTPQQAADSILAEATQYNSALVQLRTVRLNAKELIRTAMADGQVEQAQDIAAETIASIEAAVAGIGNNAGV